MKKCSVVGCDKTIENSPKTVFFCSPILDIQKRMQWATATGRTFKEKATFYVCQDHFDMDKDVDYYTLDKQLPKLVRTAFPSRNIGFSISTDSSLVSPKIDTSTVSATSMPNSTATFTIVASCSTTNVVNSPLTYTSTPTETSTVQSSSGSLVTSLISPTKRKYFSSSDEPEVTSGSLYEPEDDDEYTSDSEEYDSDLDEFGEEVSDELSFNEDESRLVCELTIKAMRKKLQHYTGIPEASAYVLELIEKIAKISLRNLFLVLRKMRHNETFVVLGDLFGMSVQQASYIFSTDVVKLAEYLHAFIYWPDAKEIQWNLPLQFKHKYKEVKVIIDCFESSIAKPSNPVDQALSWSSYKHSNTLKYLIGSTPDGFIIFISKGFTGRITDNEIVKRSGFLEFIREGCEVLADRGFKDIEIDVVSKGGKLIKPPSTEAAKIYTPEEAKECKSVAAVRIHIERVIGKLRNFNFLKPQHSFVNYKRTYLFEYSVIIACAISNMQGLLTKI